MKLLILLQSLMYPYLSISKVSLEGIITPYLANDFNTAVRDVASQPVSLYGYYILSSAAFQQRKNAASEKLRFCLCGNGFFDVLTPRCSRF